MIVRWLLEREQCEVVSGWCPSSSVVVCGMAVVCAALVCQTQCVWAMPSTPSAVFASTVSCRALFPCQVLHCGWCMSLCAVRVVGYPLHAPPLMVVVGGALWIVGVA